MLTLHMHSLPLVSVIIPVYNAEKWILSSYEQVTSQTYSNLEVVYIDNSSTDRSLEQLNKLAGNDVRVKIYSESKKGAGAARNTGIRHASGEIISFLDVDDELEPNKIEYQVNLLLTHPNVQIVFGSVLKFYQDSGKSYMVPVNPAIEGIIEPPHLAKLGLQNFNNLPGTISATCRKSAALDVGGFEENLQRGEDAAFFIKMTLHYKSYFDNKKVAKYIRHPTSSTTLDNRIDNGNPYYLQFKLFYLPYVSDFTCQTWYKDIHRLVARKTVIMLFKQVKKIKTTNQSPWQFLKRELSELNRSGLPKQHSFMAILLSYTPNFISTIIVKIWFKIFG